MKMVNEDSRYESDRRSCRRDDGCCRRDERCCGQQPGKAILKCGSGGVGPLPVISTPLSNPIPVASVSIDTRAMECPKVLLHFTCQINLPADAGVNLNFMISRTTNCGCPQYIGGTFTFSDLVAVLEAESFSFQQCDCNTCQDCVTYTVEIDPSSLIAVTAGVTITNATLTALAVEDLC